jgi:flagellar hook-basal body complex protein FliE
MNEELEQATGLINFYNYAIDKNLLIKLYAQEMKKKYILSMKNPKFDYAIELIMMRIEQAEMDLKRLVESQSIKHTDRPRVIEAEIKHLKKSLSMVEKYSTTKKGAELQKLLNGAICDLERITKNTRTKAHSMIDGDRKLNNNIRYGYNNNLEIMNERAKYLETDDKHKTEAINLQLELLISDLEDDNIDFVQANIKALFKSYFLEEKTI